MRRTFAEARRSATGDATQDILDQARIVGGEQAFLVGVRVLTGSISAAEAGRAYALLAEKMVASLLDEVTRDFEDDHGKVPGGGAVVVAMGKLGGREMTASSDIDLILIYDAAPDVLQSDGRRPLAPSHYYARLTQRLITALSAPTAEGALYDVDMRLRPSGQKGPMATRLTGFVNYQRDEAWTWEHMALTRARVIAGSAELTAQMNDAIRTVLVLPRDRAKIVKDVTEMRAMIAAEKGSAHIWDLKQTRGGLVDLEFIAQYLQLVHAADHPAVLSPSTLDALEALARAGVLAREDADKLLSAGRLLHDLTQLMRLCLDQPFDPETAPGGLKAMLARAGDTASFPALEVRLTQALGDVSAAFDRLIR
ncbi:MAG: hypothetical protein ACRCS9_05115 [Hyphomicrobium sp.]